MVDKNLASENSFLMLNFTFPVVNGVNCPHVVLLVHLAHRPNKRTLRSYSNLRRSLRFLVTNQVGYAG